MRDGGIEREGAAAFEQERGGVCQRVSEVHFAAEVFAESDRDLLEFETEGAVGFGFGGGVALEGVPDLDDEFAGDGGDGDVAVAFAGEESPAPFAEVAVAAFVHDALGPLDEELAQVAAAAFADAQADVLVFAALALAGVEPDVGDEALGAVEAPDVADDGQEGEGVDDSDAEHFHAAHHGGVVAHCLADELVEAFAACAGLLDGTEVFVEEAVLQGCPLPLFADPVGGGFGVGVVCFAEADAVGGEQAFEGVGGGGVGGDGFVVEVEEVAAFAAFFVGDPDAGGVAGEVDEGHAGGGHFVVVGIGLGVFADMGAFEHAGAQAEFAEPVADFEAVGAGFEEDEVLGVEFGAGPLEQTLEAVVAAGAELAGVVRGLARVEGEGEGVGVGVDGDDPTSVGGWRWRDVGFHAFAGCGWFDGFWCFGF